MEMMRIREKIKSREGASFIVFIGVLIALITLFLVIFEYFRVMGMHEAITEELERSGNIAVEYAMIDEARGYHISKIDSEEAKKQFDTYFKKRLNLTDDYIKYGQDREKLYWLSFDKFEVDAETPKITMKGTIYVNLQLVGSYVAAPIELSFDVITRNLNTAD